MRRVKLKDDRTIKRYSESFKLKVLEELSEGKYTKAEIQRIYGIGAGSLYGWIKKYGKLALYNRKIRIEMPQEKDRIKELHARIRELEKALVNTQLKHLCAEAELATALQMLGYQDKEDFLKKQKSHRSKMQ